MKLSCLLVAVQLGLAQAAWTRPETQAEERHDDGSAGMRVCTCSPRMRCAIDAWVQNSERCWSLPIAYVVGCVNSRRSVRLYDPGTC